ncbi:MAG: FAD-dependent oxidoreductase [Erysipelotrichaceae bacterium]|jgi:thioredoxin reductase (NADPH)|nr:FAD-dependent oxidoreductase [Erysipelotrichaceae bacterium]
MDKQFDVIIVGAGPAGMTAGLYGARYGLSVAILDAMIYGGKMQKTYEIENYPGTGKTSGAALSQTMYEQTEAAGVTFLFDEIERIEDGEVKRLYGLSGEVYHGRAVILASGTRERLLGIPGEETYTGRGVSYCAVCDGMLFKNKKVVVIGGGNSALEEALYLANLASSLTIVIRRDQFRAQGSIVDKVLTHPNITVLYQKVPVEILGDGSRVNGIVLKDSTGENTMTLACDGVFPYIGADPVSGYFASLGICDKEGYLLCDEYMRTPLAGFYGAGDLRRKELRQVVTAVSDGALAATAAFHDLNK